MSYNDRCLTCNTECTSDNLCACCKDKQARRIYCNCAMGPKLDNRRRNQKTKRRCERCHLIVFVFDAEGLDAAQ